MNGGPDMADAQRRHWQTTFHANPHMYGIDPSAPGAYVRDPLPLPTAGVDAA